MPIEKRSIPRSSTQLLRQIIEDTALTEAIQSLPSLHLARLVEHVGLEDAGEILLFATSEQLLGVFDTDLWLREQGGEAETFDPNRFLLWLEVLLESGEKALVTRLGQLPEDLLFLAFHSHILVLNLDDLMADELSKSRNELDQIDKALESCLGHEIDEYFVIAKQHDGWDTILTTILAFYEHDPDLLQRILSRCCYTSSEYIEENGGLYEVLTAEEMLMSDASADRADRRAEQGYISSTDAAAFLRLAAATAPNDIIKDTTSDPVTNAYFRELAPEESRKSTVLTSNSTTPSDTSASRLRTLLEHAEVREPSLPLLFEAKAVPSDRGHFQAALTTLFESDPQGHESRLQSLIYLANIIEAGLGSTQMPIRPADAMKAVLGVCDVGLCHVASSDCSAEMLRQDRSPITLFRLGWRLLSTHSAIHTLVELEQAISCRLSR